MKLSCCRIRRCTKVLWLGAFLFRLLLPDTRAADGHWDSRFWLPIGISTRVAIDPSNRLILAGSNLSPTGPNGQYSLLRWDGRRWEFPVGGSLSANALLTTETNLIVAGKFTRTGTPSGLTNIASFDGVAWHPFGDGLPGTVFALARDGSTLVAGGDFLTTNQTQFTNVARWDGQDWQAMGSGVPGRVLSLANATNGGFFAASDGVTGQTPASVWHWNGQDWTQVGDFGDAGARRVRRLLWTSNTLFAALAPPDASPCVMQWLGNQWSPVGDVPLSGTAEAFATPDGVLTVGGVLSWVREGETNKSAIARLVNGRWEADLSLPSHSVLDLASRGRETYAIGLINNGIVDKTYRGVWHHDGTSWGQLNNGLTTVSYTERVAAFESRLIVLGTPSRSELWPGLEWNGRMWLRLGVSPAAGFTLRPSPRDLAVVGTNLFAGAVANSTATGSTNVLVRLVGTNWVQATDGFPFQASAICGTRDRVFVGGRLTTANGGTGAVWEWDGTTWRQLGGQFSVTGPTGSFSISSLFLFHDTLHAAGNFSSVDGAAATNLASWDGLTWKQAGEPLDGAISAVSVVGQQVYMAGAFTNVNVTPLNHVAVWNGSNWAPLGDGVPFSKALAISGRRDGVVAAGGQRANKYEVWLWKDNQWTLIGDNQGNAFSGASALHMIWTGHDLNLAGSFYTMGPYDSDPFAIWHDAPALAELSGYDSSGASLTFTGALPARFTVERSPDLGAWTSVATNTPANPAEIFLDRGAVTNAVGFYRAVSQP